MRKIVLIGALALGLGNVAIAEESGAFVGVEVGFANVQASAKGTDLASVVWDYEEKSIASYYGFKAGYKYFFTQNLGVRAYGAFNYSDALAKSSGSVGGNDLTGKTEATFTTITANADFLFNFYSVDNADVGAFVGLGLGMIDASYNDTSFAVNESPSGMYADAKIGLRANAGKNHGADLAIKIPFTDAKKTINGVDLKMRQSMILSIGYNYSF